MPSKHPRSEPANPARRLEVAEIHRRLQALGEGSKDWMPSATESRMSSAVVEYLGDRKFRLTAHPKPQVFRHENGLWYHHRLEDVEHIFFEPTISRKKGIGLRSSHVAAQIFDDHARYLDVGNREESVGEERFTVEAQNPQTASWEPILAPSPDLLKSLTAREGSDRVEAVAVYENENGILTLEYVVRDASPLKHTITFQSKIMEQRQFRLLHEWRKIDSTTVRDEKGEERLIDGRIELPPSRFLTFLRWNREVGVFEDFAGLFDHADMPRDEPASEILSGIVLDVESESGKSRACFIYGDWRLAAGESFKVDPTTGTYYSSTEDGLIYHYNNSNWATTHNAATGLAIEKTGTAAVYSMSAYRSGTDNNWYCVRSFFYFDTSGIPDEATIDAAAIYLYGYTYGTGKVAVQKGTQSDTLALADYDAFTGSEYGHTSSWTTSGYNSISFDATGRGDINKTGTTKVCAREYDHDYLNADPGYNYYRCGCYFTEYTGTDHDPYLSVDYTAPTTEYVNVSDSAAGADTVASILEGGLVADAASGADTAGAADAITITDASSGADLVSTTDSLLVVDDGLGIDLLALEESVLITDSSFGVDIAYQVQGEITIDALSLPHVQSIYITEKTLMATKLIPRELPFRKFQGKMGRVIQIQGWTRSLSELQQIKTLADGEAHLLTLPTGDSMTVNVTNVSEPRAVERYRRYIYTLSADERTD